MGGYTVGFGQDRLLPKLFVNSEYRPGFFLMQQVGNQVEQHRREPYDYRYGNLKLRDGVGKEVGSTVGFG